MLALRGLSSALTPHRHRPTGMAYMCVRSLFVLTLLQLCRAEISDSLPESWYSANVISDGFQPKPISEIFSTESPFSSTNPIVVMPRQSNSLADEILLLSTPPRKISTTSSSIGDFSTFQSTTPLPPTIHTIPPSSLQTIPSTTFQTSPSTYLSTPSTIADYSQTQRQIITQPQSQTVFQPELPRTTYSVPQPNFGRKTTLAQPQSTSSQSQSQQIQLVPRGQIIPAQNLPEQQLTTRQQQTQTSTVGPQSNYFLIYQQAPQSIQSFPGLVGSSQEVPQFSTVAPSSTTREPSTVIIQPVPTVSRPSTRTVPPSPTTPFPKTVRVQSTPTGRATYRCQNATTPIPRLPAKGGPFPLSIRVVAPSGSITNVNFHGTSKTTTKRPTTSGTRKTPRPKKNNYDTCTDGCKGKREPICAAPLSTDFLDPNTLKGFPSVCHMACHNYYKKDSYEKVLDGRCSRLRTRIRTIDSNTKLKREELTKAHYSLDNSGTKTVFEFSGLHK